MSPFSSYWRTPWICDVRRAILQTKEGLGKLYLRAWNPRHQEETTHFFFFGDSPWFFGFYILGEGEFSFFFFSFFFENVLIWKLSIKEFKGIRVRFYSYMGTYPLLPSLYNLIFVNFCIYFLYIGICFARFHSFTVVNILFMHIFLLLIYVHVMLVYNYCGVFFLFMY